MKPRVTLTITSLLSAILFSLHWADEVARGLEPGTTQGVGGFLILAVWLSATLVFADRWWGLVIILLAAILASGVPILHMQGKGWVEGRYGTGSVMFFWVWTNIALGVTGMLSLVLSVRALWSLRSGRRGEAS
ncbi:MAG TPA: hypothetical protein VLT17_10330 [Gemmatimonadales bacterium]|jgi:hypothetical protein|nr:hypothetical protein [Gemmatimonadales bacterium]